MRELDSKLDQAARIAWMYYVEAQTQDQIAKKLGLSRQAAQRALYLARSEGLVKVRLDHPVAECMELARAIQDLYGLEYCEVAPAMSTGSVLSAVAVIAAGKLESYLASRQPLTVGIGTGRFMRAMVDEVSHMDATSHRVVGPIGIIAPDGAANPFDAVAWLADKIGARKYQLPAPILADSIAEREAIQRQRIYRVVSRLAASADVTFVGVGTIDEQAPLRQEGCITLDEVNKLQEKGAAGEIIGWVIDAKGDLLRDPVNDRITSLPLQKYPQQPVIGVAGGMTKCTAVRAALTGKWLNGLITDEHVATSLLA